MTPFSVLFPARVVFKVGASDSISEIVASYRQPSATILVLTDRGLTSTGIPSGLAATLVKAGFSVRLVDIVPPEPTDGNLDSIAKLIKSSKVEIIVAIGGGSVIDAAKVLSVLAVHGGTTASLVESGVPGPGIPIIAMPTTAGTGSEATANAIVLFPEQKIKTGIISPHFMPACVVLDPSLSIGLPPALTASTGIDALCHLLECFIGKKANPFSDMYALQGMQLLIPALPAVFKNGNDLEARSAMMLAAYYGGVCIASSGTNAIHALSYPLGGKYRVPHGLANAALLLPVMNFQRDRIAARLARVTRSIGYSHNGDDQADTRTLIDSFHTLITELGIPTRLADLDVPAKALDELTEAAYGVRRLLDNNPVDLSKADIRAIYESMI